MTFILSVLCQMSDVLKRENCWKIWFYIALRISYHQSCLCLLAVSCFLTDPRTKKSWFRALYLHFTWSLTTSGSRPMATRSSNGSTWGTWTGPWSWTLSIRTRSTGSRALNTNTLSQKMSVIEIYTSKAFSVKNDILNKFLHLLLCLNIAYPFEDWDQGRFSVKQYKERHIKTNIEMAWCLSVNIFSSFLMLTPLWYTGIS